MSVPVCYSAAAVMQDNWSGDRSAETAEVRWQRISEGRLGTPDAAATSNSHLVNQQQHIDNALQQQYLRIETPPSEELFPKLQEALALEMKYQPCLYLPKESHVSLLSLFFIELKKQIFLA